MTIQIQPSSIHLQTTAKSTFNYHYKLLQTTTIHYNELQISTTNFHYNTMTNQLQQSTTINYN